MTKVKEPETAEVMGAWELPNGWKWKLLGKVCQINPRRPRLTRDSDALTSFLPMSNVNEVEGVITKLESRPYKEVVSGFTYFKEGDVLFAKITPSMENGKCAIARGLIDDIGFGSTEFYVLRPGAGIAAEWVHKYLRRLSLRLEAKLHFRGAVGQQRVPLEFLDSCLIPLPPIPDIQFRIISRIESLLADFKDNRQILEEMRRDTNGLMEATLAQLIEDLDKRYPNSPTIGELLSSRHLKILGGGTPPTDNEKYWVGSILWASPKDMKCWYLDATHKHISQIALQEKKLKIIPEGTVLIVVRGMILAHTLPIGITKNEVTINQDMKALVPSENIVPEYLGYILRARAPSILQQVETAAHGTKRLKTDTLKQVVVPNISKNEQRRIVEYLDSVQSEVNDMQKLLEQDATSLDELEQSILEQAFRGKL
ncbi:restriction endonuclease subunit S [Microcoleus sp. ZQ-A2]|nr:restriction endonuclease subunit S [Microcoleus sp. FACHB-1]